MTDVKKRIRCAIYTRKSTEEGLEMEFNSLDAQREAGEAYVTSQKHEGWMLVPDYYDDGGFTGGNIERPALKRLMNDVESGKIDIIVVYKVDRLSRALSDFAKLIDVFDRHNVSFVSVTQQFNTTTSMGRLTLNILLSFAQFEREVIGERIRDKFAASKRKGMWMGGAQMLGYDVKDRKLIVNEKEAVIIRNIFERFLILRSATLLAREMRLQGYHNKTYVSQAGREHVGMSFNKCQLYRILQNRFYIGDVPHKEKSYPGQHEPIIDRKTWDETQSVFKISPRKRGRSVVAKVPSLLRGLVFCSCCQTALTPVHTRKNGKQYRYYKPGIILQGRSDTCTISAIPAGELENVVLTQLKQVFYAPEMIVK
ncbi:MAG: recombinase family protein, partial [Pseudomonadota bacterium]